MPCLWGREILVGVNGGRSFGFAQDDTGGAQDGHRGAGAPITQGAQGQDTRAMSILLRYQ